MDFKKEEEDDIKCFQCFDTGEYFNGTSVVTCECERGKKREIEKTDTIEINDNKHKSG